jgi:hypothetical protein
MRSLNQDNWFLGLDLNQRPHKYEVGVLLLVILKLEENLQKSQFIQQIYGEWFSMKLSLTKTKVNSSKHKNLLHMKKLFLNSIIRYFTYKLLEK